MQKINFLICSILLLLNFSVSAQTIKFNKVYPSTVTGFNGIATADNNYRVTNWPSNIIALSDSGDIIGTQSFNDTIAIQKLVQDNNSNYISCDIFARINPNDYKYGFLITKYNSAFDTVWSNKYFLSSAIKLLYDCTIDSNNNIYACGFSRENENGQLTPKRNFVIIKIDSTGNFVWQKNYGNSFPNPEAWAIEASMDNHIISGGYTEWIGTAINSMYLLKTDLDGNPIWHLNIGDSLISSGGIQDICNTTDSCYLIVSNYKTIENSQIKNYCYLAKVSQAGLLLWESKILAEESDIFSHVVCLENNEIIAYGEAGGTGDYNFIYKFTQNGDLLWRRTIAPNSSSSFYGMKAHDFITTNDSGYVAVGEITIDGIARPYMIKMDSMGCDGFNSCSDTNLVMQLHAYNYNDSICEGDSVLISISISNGNGPFRGTINSSELINEVLYLQQDSSSYLFYHKPDITNPDLEITVEDQNNQSISETISFNVVDCNLNKPQLVAAALSIYPNPVESILHLKLENIAAKQNTICVYNPQGALVLKQESSTQNVRIDVSKLSTGIYSVQVISKTASYSKSFIKQLRN